MRILIIADAIATLKPAGDTGLSMLRGALSRGHRVTWATLEQLHFFAEELWIQGDEMQACAEKSLPEFLAGEKAEKVDRFDQVWIRKDPPFDQSYLTLCWWLALYEERVSMINPPTKLVRFHEKALPYEAFHRGFVQKEDLLETFVSLQGTKATLPFSGAVIEKPWMGFGGNHVTLHQQKPTAMKPLHMYQPFAPEIATMGDRRVFAIDGKVVGHFVRLPAKGQIEANLAQGGSAAIRPLSAGEDRIANATATFLQSIGVPIAGFDLLAGKLSEINITAPTGFEIIRDQTSVDIRDVYLDFAESCLR